MKRRNGFTLIELLAVIIILGILMIIAIPSVSKYISDSRDSVYIKTAMQIIDGARNLVNDGKHELFEMDVTYYIDSSCIKTESGNKSPYGEFDPAYVVVNYNGRGFDYYWTSRDETGHGIKEIVSRDKLNEDMIETDLTPDDVIHNYGVDGRPRYTVINKDTNCLKGEILPIEGKIDVITGKEAPVCIRATSLHTETCNRTSKGCYAAGYYVGGEKNTTTIVYGNDPQTRNDSTFTAGDAFDCDVNNDGVYNPTSERFYYLRSNGNNAVLVYYTNITNTGTSVLPTLIGKTAYDSSNTSSHGPQTGYLQLPSITEWDNPGISLPGERQIVNENGVNTVNKGNTTIDSFPYTDRAARFLTYQDVVAACNVGLRREKDLDSCTYLMERTTFVSTSNVNGYWLETPLSTSSRDVLGTNFEKRYVGYTNASATSNAIRPVIEVPKDKITLEKSVKATVVTFDANGGTFSNGTGTNEVEFYQYTRVVKNGTYLIPTKAGQYFAGWKVLGGSQTFTNLNNYVATQSMTLVAEWTNTTNYTCIRVDNAADLHTETCNRSSNYCAMVVGNGSTITYGKIANPGVLRAGNAFNCDLNGNGVYDERFYYVSDYFDTVASANTDNVFDTSYGVLVYYSNFKSGVGAVDSGSAYNSGNKAYEGPTTLVDQLPTTSEWSNVSLKTTDRQILSDYDYNHNSTKSGSYDLPLFSYAGKAARLLTGQEVMRACGIARFTGKVGELDGCEFLLEKTDYAASGRPTVSMWLETTYTNGIAAMRANAEQRSVLSSNTNQTNKGLRPAIEIPKSRLLY